MKKIKSLISILLVILTVAGILMVPATASSYSDVPNGQWYTEAIEWCTKYGLMSGLGNNKFEPNRPITRAEFATMLYKAAKRIAPFTGSYRPIGNETKGKWIGMAYLSQYEPTYIYYEKRLQADLDKLSAKKNPFSDVPQYDSRGNETWYYRAINWCYNKGITNGTSSRTFSPWAYITRQDALTMLLRWWFAITQIYKVEKITGWHWGAIEQIYNNEKSINNYSYSSKIPESNPNNMSIGMAYNKDTYDLKKQAVFRVFTDANQISGYALPAVVWAVTSDKIRDFAGFINGVGEYNIAPKSYITRAQMATIMCRLLKDYAVENDISWRSWN